MIEMKYYVSFVLIGICGQTEEVQKERRFEGKDALGFFNMPVKLTCASWKD